LTLAAAAASAMVIVNTVVIVRGLGLGQSEVALTLAAFGSGSILTALALPRILDRVADRTVMLLAATGMVLMLALLAAVTASMRHGTPYWHVLLLGWLFLGIAYSASVTLRDACCAARARLPIVPHFSRHNSRSAMPAG
jgi:predicted MFS family arabinose efflux permease